MFREEKVKRLDTSCSDNELKMAKQDVEMKEAPKQNDAAETEEPKAEVSKEEKERLVLEGMISQFKVEKKL